jgi:hypothetical protein
LENLVTDPIAYAHVVKHIGKEIDFTSVNFNTILTQCALGMAVQLSDRIGEYLQNLFQKKAKRKSWRHVHVRIASL